jgi:hypothetical protein
VGKLALVGIFCIICLGGVGVRSSDSTVEITCAVLATISALAIAGGIVWYSHEHPDQATLEGMEVVVMHHQKFLAAKGIPNPALDAPGIPDPTQPPPQLTGGDVPEQD